MKQVDQRSDFEPGNLRQAKFSWSKDVVVLTQRLPNTSCSNLECDMFKDNLDPWSEKSLSYQMSIPGFLEVWI